MNSKRNVVARVTMTNGDRNIFINVNISIDDEFFTVTYVDGEGLPPVIIPISEVRSWTFEDYDRYKQRVGIKEPSTLEERLKGVTHGVQGTQ